MLDLTDTDVDYKIAPSDSLSIIGSNSIHTAGDLYLVNINAITRRDNKRNKRIFDISVAVVIICFCWLLIWFLKNKKQILANAIHVLTGELSWVGYIPDEPHKADLPPIKKGVLNPGMLFAPDTLSGDRVRQLNILYAKDYRMWNDLELVFKNPEKTQHNTPWLIFLLTAASFFVPLSRQTLTCFTGGKTTHRCGKSATPVCHFQNIC